MADLDRFKTAQDSAGSGFATALAELRAGRKQSHWIWYVFPQLGGLGSSPMAVRYALDGPAEAEEYVRDPVLGERLLAVTEAAWRHLGADPPVPLRVLMGSGIDALKLISSMTLFERVAAHLSAQEPGANHADVAERLAELAGRILAAMNSRGYPPCAHTERCLRAAGYG